MDVGHSRLLKFLLPNNIPNMSEKQELRVQYLIEPSNVESEVPEQQNLRHHPDDADAPENGEDQLDNANDQSTFVPIFKMKKEEAVFTKGDMKLQKVSVTESISEDDLSSGEIIKSQQTLKKGLNSDEDPEINKPRSRIPKLRQVAEKFKQDRKEAREKEMPSKQPRRSSIPKLKKYKTSSTKDTENVPTDDTHKWNEQDKTDIQSKSNNNENDHIPPEEEFDKIFDEIIHNDDEPIFNTNVLVDSFDAEKLEQSFEEIIHDYEENRVQPIEINQIRSKIPLVKQKSLPEEKFAQKLKRRSSLKDIPINDIDSKVKSVGKVSKLEDIKRKFNSSKENDVKLTYTCLKNIEMKSDSDDTNVEKSISSESQPKAHNDIKIMKDKETIKIITPVLKEHHKVISKYETKVDKESKSKPVKAVYDLENKETINDLHKSTETDEELKVDDESVHEMSEKPVKIEYSLPTPTMNTANVLGLDKHAYTSETAINFKPSPQKLVEPSKKKENGAVSDRKNTTTLMPELKGKVSGLIHIFRSDEQSPTQPPKKSIISNTDVFIKNTDIENKKSNNSPKQDVNRPKVISENILNEDVITNNASEVSDEQVSKTDDLNNPPSQETDEVILEDNFNRESDEEDTNKLSKLAEKVRRDSIENLKFVIVESVSTEIPTKLKLNLKSVTPPNTPQVYDYEPYKDSAHVAGEPKILNIDVRPKRSASDVYNQIEYDRSQSIDFHSSNPDDLDKAPLFKAVNNKINTEAKNNEFDESSTWIKGKVDRIVNKIHSIDESAENINKKENTVGVPIKKSVSSRIAMFECQAPSSESRPKLKLLLNTKPIIIEEVLKTQPPREMKLENLIHKTNELKDEIDSVKKYPERKHSVEGISNNYIVYENVEHVAKVVEVQDLTTEEDIIFHNIGNADAQSDFVESGFENNSIDVQCGNQENDIVEESTAHKDYSAETLLTDKEPLPKPKKELLLSRIGERFKRVKSVNEEGNMKKSKSVAELDLGDAVKGKVHQLIVRMNSIEKIEMEKKHNHNINIKERPRKRSVSEKIALFENKLAAVDMNDVTKTTIAYDNAMITARVNTQPETTPNTLSEKYKQRIEDLKNAKVKYGKMEDIMYIKLKNGQDMPVLILGTALLDPIILPYTIEAAIDLGYRAIDTAYIYGNEKLIGEAVKAKIDDGTVKREDLFIIGKLWSTFHRQDLVEKACVASLELLGLDYFDLYLVHNPMSFKEGGEPIPKIANVLQYSDIDYMDAWYGMEHILKKGFAKGIGVSNFNSKQIERVVDKAKIKPVANQVECHPYLSQQRLDQFCAERNISLICFGTLGSKGTPDEYKGNLASVIDDPLVKVMAAGLNVTAAQLLIRYQIECGRSVVTKCSTAAHLWDNLQAQTFHLNSTEVDALHALHRNKRTYVFKGMGDTHRNYPFKIPF